MILSSLCLSLIQIIFATWFVIRTSRKYSSTFFSEKARLTKIGTAFIVLTSVISVHFRADSFWFFIPSGAIFLFLVLFPFTLSKILEIRCHKGFYDLMPALIFEMKCGKSLTTALHLHARKLPKPFRLFIESGMENSSQEDSSPPSFLPKSVVHFVFEFQKISRQRSSQLEQLAQLQKQMRLDALLRHKSSQALLQTKIQCVFIVFIFVCVGMYGLSSYPWNRFRPFLFASAVLLASGLLLLKGLTRKRKWKT